MVMIMAVVVAGRGVDTEAGCVHSHAGTQERKQMKNRAHIHTSRGDATTALGPHGVYDLPLRSKWEAENKGADAK